MTCRRHAGVNETVKVYCEARNARGISVSRTGTVFIKGETAIWHLANSRSVSIACVLASGSVEDSDISSHDSVAGGSCWTEGWRGAGRRSLIVVAAGIHGSLRLVRLRCPGKVCGALARLTHIAII